MTSPLEWPKSKARETMDPDEVQVWAWPLDPVPVGLSADVALLDPAELRRMNGFYFAPDRARYAVSHSNLRRILGACLNRPPQRVSFRANRFGKPELLGEDPSIRFSLSHSHSVGVLAVTRGGPIGVDVEDVKPIEPEVAIAHFSAAELLDLGRLRGDAWLNGFYRCWTRKEAVLKAEGVGLHRALNGFDVSLLPDAPPELLQSRIQFSYAWKLYDVCPEPGTIGALAVTHSPARLTRFRFLA